MHQDISLFKYINFLLLLFSLLFFIASPEAREPLPPRFSANAYTGVYTVGQADLMVSLDGDSQHNLYVDPQGAYGSDQQWYGDVGLGYRWIKNDAAILGWYLFAGHSRVENSSGFWIVSPGIEALGSRWDARINAYIPVAGRSHELGVEEFNIVSEPFFTGHTEVINSAFNMENAIQQIGNGADARVGYQLFRTVPLKGYLGAYFFSIANTDNVQGGAAGLEYWFDDNIRVFANYSYDNYQHSKLVGGLGISFGGVRKHWADPSLSERLTDPVDRYLANLGHGSGIPSKTLLYGMGPGSSTELISTDIAFFSQTGTPNNGGTGLNINNCTFENPCGPTDFTQTGVDSLAGLLPNTQIFFNGGTYTSNNTAVNLNLGQSLQSRTADYSQVASGSARSTIVAAQIGLVGNNSLDNIILLPLDNPQATGVSVSGANNLITGSRIDTSGVLESNFTALSNAGNNTLINNSEVFIGSFSSGVAIENTNMGTMTIQNSRLNGEDGGVVVTDGNVVINNSQILVNGNSAISGLFITENGVLNLINTTVTVTNGSADESYVINNSGTATITGGVLSVTATPGVIAVGPNPVTIRGDTVCQINGTTVVCP